MSPESQALALPAECCGQAEWVKHHADGHDALLCVWLVGKGGALYIPPEGNACRICRHSPAFKGDAAKDFVAFMARILASGFGPDAAQSQALLKRLLGKGRTGVDRKLPGARELFGEVLERACRRGLDPDAALAMAREEGLSD